MENKEKGHTILICSMGGPGWTMCLLLMVPDLLSGRCDSDERKGK